MDLGASLDRPLRRDPKFIPLLRSGRLPSLQVCEHLQNLLEEVESTITRDQDAIWDLKCQIGVLRDRVSVQEENKHLLESLFAPIRQTPPELMQHIFELAVGANHFGGAKPVSTATRIASVCAQWRSIAQSTPRIWAKFVVEFPSTQPSRQGSLFKSLERHLAFAGDAELEIDLRAPKSAVTVDDEILALFTARAPRWRSARFKLKTITSSAQEILTAALSHLPSLTSLHIFSPEFGGYTCIRTEFFKSCPALRDLSLVEFNPQATSTLPWAQLTRIHFAPADASEINTVLQLCPKLVSVSLRVEASASLEIVGPSLAACVHQMRTLRIESSSTSRARTAHAGVSTICTALTLPQLKSFVVASSMYRKYTALGEARHEVGHWPQKAVVQMITRSKCKLKTLRLVGVPLDTDEALELLRLAPNAVEVSLHECKTRDPESLSEARCWAVEDDIGANHFVTTKLLTALGPTVSDAPTSDSAPALAPLLPCLRRLHLKVNTGFDMEAYMRMLRSRWPAPGGELARDVSRLSTISLVVMSFLDFGADWDSKPLLAMKKEGLLIKYDDGDEECYGYYDQVESDDSDSDYDSGSDSDSDSD
ncbi:hypothetical protein C8R46DRAFT_1356634 [Mycena filopes]|nr:hypothetical protein C8R46DRAFT_1356634 [Mycena filopes]